MKKNLNTHSKDGSVAPPINKEGVFPSEYIHMDLQDISVASLAGYEPFQQYCLNPGVADLQHWEQWLATHPEHAQTVEEARKLVLSLAGHLSVQEIEEARTSLMKQIEQKELKAPVRKTTWLRRSWMGVAATVLILLGGGIYWELFRPVPIQKHLTDFGQTLEVQLPDESQVTLNANSTIRFAEHWDKQAIREVWLEGEAFFDITHDPSHPFVLHTSHGDVEVLGTSFNTYQRFEKLNVTLIEGKVSLTLEDESKIQLKPGEQVRVNEAEVIHEPVDTEAILAWKFDKMIFRNTSISQIVEQLKADFDWTIQVQKQEILEKRINAVIQQNDPQVLLNALAEIYDLDIKRISEKNYVIQ